MGQFSYNIIAVPDPTNTAGVSVDGASNDASMGAAITLANVNAASSTAGTTAGTGSGSGSNTTTVLNLSYGYDANSQLTSVIDGVGTAASGWDSATFTYDGLRRLNTAKGTWGTYTYTLDALGNMQTRVGSAALSYSYDSANGYRLNGVSGTTSRTYAYDAMGRVSNDGRYGYGWNLASQITSAGGASYFYDGNNKRVKTTAANGTLEYAFYSLGGKLVYTLKAGTSTIYVDTDGGTRVEHQGNGTDTYQHTNWQGSALVATDAAGKQLWREHYDPYGSKLSGVATKRGYTGHSYDAETGNTYMLARSYDPAVGRFLMPDPVGSADDLNVYGYVKGDPVNATDPTGMLMHSTFEHFLDSCSGAMNIDGTNANFGDTSTGTNIGSQVTPTQVAQINSDPTGMQVNNAPARPNQADRCAQALAVAHADEAGVARVNAEMPTIQAAAAANGVPAALVGAVALRESNGQNEAEIGGGHGQGMFQLTDRPGVTAAQANNTAFGANYAAGMLHDNISSMRRAHPDMSQSEIIQAAAAAYNHGPGRVNQNLRRGLDIDHGTAHNNYGGNTRDLMDCFPR